VIPWAELTTADTPLRVLDPMAGSGTTLAVARQLGHEAIGFDTDPLAVLIANAWCCDVDTAQLRRAANQVLQRARLEARDLPQRAAYPAGADRPTKAFVRYWFDLVNRRQLTALARAIQRLRRHELKTPLWCAFSRLIIAKQAGASLALDLAHSRPHRRHDKVTVIRPFESFTTEVDKLCLAAPFTEAASETPAARIAVGDARNLPLDPATIDVVITSPPYLNAIDYQRMTKFSLVWMGYSVDDLREIRASNVGTEFSGAEAELTEAQADAFRAMGNTRVLSERSVRMLKRYIRDMDSTVAELARVLKPGGRALIVIGDSTIRGCYVRNSCGLAQLAEARGLRVTKAHRRRLPPNRRYLPPPRAKTQTLDSRLRTEVLLHLEKAS
jgi:adenine-specific DNA methylase